MEPDHQTSPPYEETLLERIKENILHPGDFCRKYPDEPLGVTFQYYAKMIAVSLVIQILAILPFIFIPESQESLLAGAGFSGISYNLFIVLYVILSIVVFFIYMVLPFIDGLVTQIGVLIVGGKQGSGRTIRAVMLSYTPYFILQSILFLFFSFSVCLFDTLKMKTPIFLLIVGCILILIILIVLWTLMTKIIAVRVYQDTSTPRAVFAVLFPLILLMGIFILLMILWPAGGMQDPVDLKQAQFYRENSFEGISDPAGVSILLLADELPHAIQDHRATERNLTIMELPAEKFGCLKMYHAQYSKYPKMSVKTGLIIHDIMIFPPDRATEMMTNEVESYNPDSSGVPEQISCPDLGDERACFKTLLTDMATGDVDDSYVLIFQKGDIVEKLSTLGPDPDFELVKEIATRSAAKIPDTTD